MKVKVVRWLESLDQKILEQPIAAQGRNLQFFKHQISKKVAAKITKIVTPNINKLRFNWTVENPFFKKYEDLHRKTSDFCDNYRFVKAGEPEVIKIEAEEAVASIGRKTRQTINVHCKVLLRNY